MLKWDEPNAICFVLGSGGSKQQMVRGASLAFRLPAHLSDPRRATTCWCGERREEEAIANSLLLFTSVPLDCKARGVICHAERKLACLSAFWFPSRLAVPLTFWNAHDPWLIPNQSEASVNPRREYLACAFFHCSVIKCTMISVEPNEDNCLLCARIQQGNLEQRASVLSIGHAPKMHSALPARHCSSCPYSACFKVISCDILKPPLFFYGHKWGCCTIRPPTVLWS